MPKGILKSFKQEDLPENYFRSMIIILRYTGIEVEREETLLYSIFSKISLFVLVYSYTCVEAYELYVTWGDINAMTVVLNYLVTHIIGAIKINDMYLNRKRYKNLIKKMHEGFFKPDVKRGGLHEQQAIRNVIKKTEIQVIYQLQLKHRQLKLQLLIFYAMVMMIVIGGLIEAMRVRFTHPREDWHLPYLSISLIDTSTSPIFEFAFFYQTFCIIAVGLQIATTDVLRTSLMAHLSVQLNILQHSFRNMRKRAEDYQKLQQCAINQNFDSSLRKILADSVNHHWLIFEFAKETEELCSNVVLIIVLSTVMQLCFLLYQTSLVPIQSVVFVQFFVYWIDIAYQTAQYCYWGNEITLESLAVAKGAAEADWPGFPNSIAKSLVLIIARSQKPINMTAGNFVPLSMAFLMTIVKGSFSYFMVLRQMNEAKITHDE